MVAKSVKGCESWHVLFVYRVSMQQELTLYGNHYTWGACWTEVISYTHSKRTVLECWTRFGVTNAQIRTQFKDSVCYIRKHVFSGMADGTISWLGLGSQVYSLQLRAVYGTEMTVCPNLLNVLNWLWSRYIYTRSRSWFHSTMVYPVLSTGFYRIGVMSSWVGRPSQPHPIFRLSSQLHQLLMLELEAGICHATMSSRVNIVYIR